MDLGREQIRYDPETGLFYMYCSDEEFLKKIITVVVGELKKTEA